jgi:hypothetical protein
MKRYGLDFARIGGRVSDAGYVIDMETYVALHVACNVFDLETILLCMWGRVHLSVTVNKLSTQWI